MITYLNTLWHESGNHHRPYTQIHYTSTCFVKLGLYSYFQDKSYFKITNLTYFSILGTANEITKLNTNKQRKYSGNFNLLVIASTAFIPLYM